MKARLLRKLLNEPNYNISNHDEYIAVGGDLCHNLISVNKETLELKYALDKRAVGKPDFNHKPLDLIWDKLEELIKSGEIKDIIDGKDPIENPLPVFTVHRGKLVESVTDKYGWPNTDDNGITMYDNTHFPEKEKAIEYGLREQKYIVKNCNERIEEKEKEIIDIKARRTEAYHNIEILNRK